MIMVLSKTKPMEKKDQIVHCLQKIVIIGIMQMNVDDVLKAMGFQMTIKINV